MSKIRKFLALTMMALMVILIMPVTSFAVSESEPMVSMRELFEEIGGHVFWLRYGDVPSWPPGFDPGTPIIAAYLENNGPDGAALMFSFTVGSDVYVTNVSPEPGLLHHPIVVINNRAYMSQEDVNYLVLRLAAGEFWTIRPAVVHPPAVRPPTTSQPATGGNLLAHTNGTLFTRAEILAHAADMLAPSGKLVLGHAHSTWNQNNFIRGFSGATVFPEQWILELLYGGVGTMVMDRTGKWLPNPLVLREPVEHLNHRDGSRTYTFTIYTDNLWSDGTPITATDYVFNILAYSSPEMRAIGANATAGLNIKGFEEFSDGADIFSGVRLYSEDSFSVTIRAEMLPYIWDFIFQSWEPLPFHYWNQGGNMVITDTPHGVRLDGLEGAWLTQRLNAAAGIRSNPTVFSGPYMISYWDANTGDVILERNPLFQGTWDGFMPQIQTLVLVSNPYGFVMDALRYGYIDMVHSIRNGVDINDGWAIIDELGLHRGVGFPRHGYGYLGFHGDHGPSQFPEVRRAIAWMLDRQDFARQFTWGFGDVKHGPYALQGWEFQTVGDYLYNHPDFANYGFYPANALQELVGGGWVLNSYGEPFNPDVDRWRYKDVTGMTNWKNEPLKDDAMVFNVGDRWLMRLEMIWAANDNRLSDIMRVVLPSTAESLGMYIVEELYPVGTTNIPAWQRMPGSPYAPDGDKFRTHHIFTLAINVPSPTRLWNQWSLYEEQQAPGFSTTWHGDWELHRLAWAMRNIDSSYPGWEERYLAAWLAFQLHFNYAMPQLPLYVDSDHDFVPLWLGNWDANAIWDFRHAVQRAYDKRTR